MKFKLCGALILSFSILLLMFSQVLADGIIIPEPPICDGDFCPEPIIPLSNSPLAIKNHIVTVKIENQLAVTHVDQVFLNTANSPLEGTYLFPLPLDAVVQQFILWVDDEPVKGKILTAEEARETYENIVRSTRDPALLEYIGRGAFQASIFPIPAGGERRIELEYSQVLTADNGLVHYSYPLNTEKFSALPLEKVSISVDLETNQPIRAVYSPDHKVEVLRTNSTKAVASYEESNIAPDTDFNLFYSFGNEEAFHLFSFRDPRDPSDPDGFFLMLTSPRPDEISRNIDKDVLLVIDRSGSMEGEKMQQAKSAARYVLNHLAANDRFHITTFSSRVEHFSDGLSSVVDSAKAVQWIDNLQASSSTDINRALLETVAVADTERPTYLLFLTDGLPTIGERDASQILVNLEKRTLENIRLFSFGVGYDVDTLLLDTLSQQNHGLTTYVKPEESLDEMLSVFYEKISTPVLTNLELDVNGVMIYDVNPQPLPDLFQGSQLIISGRYREGGSARISLSGMTNDKPKTF